MSHYIIREQLAEYLSRLAHLHSLIRVGADEQPVGEQIRGEMDFWWRQLSPEEIEQAGQLSDQLYYVHEAPPESETAVSDEIWREIDSRMSVGNWTDGIQIIRQHRHDIPASIGAFFEGLCWARLELWSVAKVFFAEAHRRRPQVQQFTVCDLGAALHSGVTGHDVELAKNTAAQSTDPAVLLKAAEVIESASDRLQDPNVEDLQIAEQIARRGIALAESRLADEALRQQVVRAHLGIALTNAILGKTSEAQVACERALVLDPNNVDAFMVAGLLSDRGDRLKNRELRSRASRRLRESNTVFPPHPAVITASPILASQ